MVTQRMSGGGGGGGGLCLYDGGVIARVSGHASSSLSEISLDILNLSCKFEAQQILPLDLDRHLHLFLIVLTRGLWGPYLLLFL